MTTDINDLVEFVRARLDDDEHAARFVLDHCAFKDPQGTHVLKWGLVHIGFDQGDSGRQYRTDAICNERFNPERILADVAAKRILIDAAAEDLDYGAAEIAWAQTVTYTLADIYADHPDYRPEWRP